MCSGDWACRRSCPKRPTYLVYASAFFFFFSLLLYPFTRGYLLQLSPPPLRSHPYLPICPHSVPPGLSACLSVRLASPPGADHTRTGADVACSSHARAGARHSRIIAGGHAVHTDIPG